jgi:hypothetical protein
VRQAAKRNGVEILEWQHEEGWGTLCSFLNKPVLDEPFLGLNEEKAMKTLTYILLARGLLT